MSSKEPRIRENMKEEKEGEEMKEKRVRDRRRARKDTGLFARLFVCLSVCRLVCLFACLLVCFPVLVTTFHGREGFQSVLPGASAMRAASRERRPKAERCFMLAFRLDSWGSTLVSHEGPLPGGRWGAWLSD